MLYRIALIIFSVLIFISLGALSPGAGAAQGNGRTETPTAVLHWSEPALVSGLLRGAWWPQLAIDPTGNVNVVFSVTGEPGGELLFLSRWDGSTWTRPADIKDGGQFIVRSALAADNIGNLHLTYSDDASSTSYANATLQDALSARGWSSPIRFTGPKNGYLSDLAIDSKGTLHAIYGESGGGQCPNCMRLTYRQSNNNGRTWSSGIKLTNNLIDRRRMQLEIDSADNLYVAWDNLNSDGSGNSGGFTYSGDGGKTWSPELNILSTRGTPNMTSVGADGKGHVILVYRLSDSTDIVYQVSDDRGKTFKNAETLPGIFGAVDVSGFDKYDMVTDSAGTIYLAISGRTTIQQKNTGLYLMQWDGEAWSKPQVLGNDGRLFYEYPSLRVSRGNQLHLTYHVRGSGSIFKLPDGTYKVYYSSATTSAPAVMPPAIPTATLTPIPLAATRIPTSTPTPTRTPLPDSVRNVSSDGGLQGPQTPIVFALVPVLLIFGLVLIWRVIFRNR